MNYCTLLDITNRVPMETLLQLADDHDQGTVDAAIIAATIASAGDLIDGYLRGRYALPLTAASQILTDIAADLCVYSLFGRRSEFATPDRASDNYRNAIKLLDKIAAGSILLGLAAPAVPPVGTSAATFNAQPRLFGRDGL